jgi:hypothetical protein
VPVALGRVDRVLPGPLRALRCMDEPLSVIDAGILVRRQRVCLGERVDEQGSGRASDIGEIWMS